MVNDEGAGTVGEYRLQCVVERIHAVRETFVVLSVAGRVGVHAFELAQEGRCHDAQIAGRGPDMRIGSVPVVSVPMFAGQDGHAVCRADDPYAGHVFTDRPLQFVLEVEQPDLDVCRRVGHPLHLGRRRLVGFRAGGRRDQYVDLEIVACDLADQKAQRLDADRQLFARRFGDGAGGQQHA